MKRVLALLIVLALVFSLVGCGKEVIPGEPVVENCVSGLVTSDGEVISGDQENYITRYYFDLLCEDGKEYIIFTTDETALVWKDETAFDYWDEGANPWGVFGEMLYVDVVYDEDKVYSDEAINSWNVDGMYDAKEILVTDTHEDYSVRCHVLTDKPVIYLYPEEKTEVFVTLDFNGKLTCTYPAYNGGWNVTAYPDGTLIDENGQEYNYLYWEGITDVKYDFSKGFCIKGEDTAAFLETALEELGLTRREANEFIVYWLPLMEQNPYNIISFQTDIYTENASLNITPTPDTLIRVFMAWYGVDAEIDIEPQELSAPKREGFTVVEWGGTEVK